MTKLFSPLTVRGVTLKNRIVMSPMCTYSCYAEDGQVTPWHHIHYGARALGQVGLIIQEATAICPQGRISVNDLGIWSDQHVPGLKELVKTIHDGGAKAGIQLGHAGRKADIPGEIIAPSAIPFSEKTKLPREMTREEIQGTIEKFIQAVARAAEAGFDIIELHGAHGYLISEFLSPLANQRQDEYGGDPDRRLRFLREIVRGVRQFWQGPLFVRISVEEYHPQGNHPPETLYTVEKLKELDVDCIDCSSGAVVLADIPLYPGYQVRFSDYIRNRADIPTSTVGLITSSLHAEEILQTQRADLIMLGRELLRNPNWPLYAARELKEQIEIPHQYRRGWL